MNKQDIKYLSLRFENSKTLTIDINNIELFDVVGTSDKHSYKNGLRFGHPNVVNQFAYQ